MESNLEKINESLFFILTCDEVGTYVSLVDSQGNVVEDASEYGVSDENDLKIIDLIKEIKEDSFFSGWDNEKNELYIDENIEILDYLKNSKKVVAGDMKPIQWFLGGNKIVLKINLVEDDSDLCEGKLLLNGEKDFTIISDNYVLNENAIYWIDIPKDTIHILKEMESKFSKPELEKYLTLASSFGSGIEIECLDYEITDEGNLKPVQELIIEKISQDNSLYLKIGASISTIDYEFLKAHNLEKALVIKDDLKRVEIIDVEPAYLDETVEEIVKTIVKHQKNLKIKSSFYVDENFIILQEKLAREFVTQELLQLAGKYKVVGTDNLKKYSVKAVKPKVVGNFKHGIDFLEGDVHLEIEGEKFSIVDVLNSFKKDSYIVLSDGTNALINRKYMEKLERVFKDNGKSNVKISFFDLPIIDDLIEDKVLANEIKKTKTFYRGINEIENYKAPVPLINATLREYQEYGYKWLRYLMDNSLGGCLADDMGLGKTLQAITLITSLHSIPGRKTLIIMPKSLIYNWESEIKKFSPTLKCGIYYGNFRDKNIFNNVDAIITTYGTVRNDIEFLRKMKFDLIVLDESQNIKNVNAQTTKAVMLLEAKYRLALSGTPIENNLGELYSLFRFLNPSMFGTLDEFNYHYANPIQKENDKEAIEELKKKIYPFILRRVKKEVLKDLPDKIEKTLFIGMNPEQKRLYEERRAYYYGMINNQIKSQGLGKTQFYILQALNELRQLTSCPEMKNPNILSSKREVLINNVQDAVENGHKVLIFTNYIKSIESITADLKKRGIKYLEMTGATKDRQGLVNLFQKDKKYKVFVMTLKTGGVGLNLTAADTIFIYDPWWNKTVENQAVDRAYRLGQDRTVFSYKLILKDTIEEKILKLQESKSQLLDNLISDEGATLKTLTEKDIEFILGE
ncbi:DEAD/DEAH box helicase [Candidatus Cetobacterium colombiensis]|uniref:SNF2-related protein n=1 Tax=Candidatus Cetobacterium colombiensis TaxID=3073100 RepID=A0ABU4WBR9_9FUSO|nr:SNF2-related protein [Candidatus Cetobacterium colombiensis]MDX8336987.1 SNF2-related protein [Candidatus Cetobacterium colombiensis]